MSDPMANGGINATRLEKAANNALLTLLSRAIMLAVVPLGGWAAGQIYYAVQENACATVKLETTLNTLISQQIPELVGRLNDRINAHADRIKSIDERNNRQDEQIDRLRDRLPPARTP